MMILVVSLLCGVLLLLGAGIVYRSTMDSRDRANLYWLLGSSGLAMASLQLNEANHVSPTLLMSLTLWLIGLLPFLGRRFERSREHSLWLWCAGSAVFFSLVLLPLWWGDQPFSWSVPVVQGTAVFLAGVFCQRCLREERRRYSRFEFRALLRGSCIGLAVALCLYSGAAYAMNAGMSAPLALVCGGAGASAGLVACFERAPQQYLLKIARTAIASPEYSAILEELVAGLATGSASIDIVRDSVPDRRTVAHSDQSLGLDSVRFDGSYLEAQLLAARHSSDEDRLLVPFGGGAWSYGEALAFLDVHRSAVATRIGQPDFALSQAMSQCLERCERSKNIPCGVVVLSAANVESGERLLQWLSYRAPAEQSLLASPAEGTAPASGRAEVPPLNESVVISAPVTDLVAREIFVHLTRGHESSRRYYLFVGDAIRDLEARYPLIYHRVAADIIEYPEPDRREADRLAAILWSCRQELAASPVAVQRAHLTGLLHRPVAEASTALMARIHQGQIAT